MSAPESAIVQHRDGSQHVYTVNPGETVMLLPAGDIIVAHPERQPFMILVSGEMVHLNARR